MREGYHIGKKQRIYKFTKRTDCEGQEGIKGKVTKKNMSDNPNVPFTTISSFTKKLNC